MNLMQQFISDWVGGIERDMKKMRPTCPDCGQEITGTSYNGRCGPCSRQSYREERSAIEDHWKEVNEP